jgi:molybdate transport system substrate-binding protein
MSGWRSFLPSRALLGWALALAAAFLVASPAAAAETQVAVAANFAAPMQQIAADFEHETGHRVRIVTGATGNLFAQIENGAPFDVFLAADESAPARLEADRFAAAGSRFTYAVGRLVLWSATPGFVDGRGDVLRRVAFRHLAVANPKLAPYGAAAMQVLDALALLEALRPKIVEGENVGQTAQFVASGSAEVGFVALSQVVTPAGPVAGSYWVVPGRLYSPIRQQAVLLGRAASNPAARALVDYLRGARALSIIRGYGYALADDVERPAPPR